MSKVIGLLTGIMLLCMAGVSDATVLTFDDINTYETYYGQNGALIGSPNGYGGLNWGVISVLDTEYIPSPSGFLNGVVSGTKVACNLGEEMAVVSDTLFDFNGVYLTSAWNDGLNITVDGYLKGYLLFSKTVTVDPTSPTWFDFNFTGIDQLTFNASGGTPHGYEAWPGLLGVGTFFAMDNFTIDETAQVPEPGTLLLLGSGLAGIGLLRKRTKAGRA